MSTLSATNLKNASSGSNNIVLNTDGTIGGAALASISDLTGVNTTGTVTSGTTSLTVGSATGIVAGMYVVGQGIAPGTTVSSIASTTVTLSAAANTTLSSAAVTFYAANKIVHPGAVGGQLCKAWVNFDGTTASPSTIRASYNVRSITKNALGDFTVNFTTSMVDANYSAVVGTGFSATWQAGVALNTTPGFLESAPSTSSFRFSCIAYNASTSQDPKYCNATVFR